MQLSVPDLLEFWLDAPPVEQMPHVAAGLLAQGYNSRHLVECAARFSTDHPEEIRASFEAALVELGSVWTDRAGAVGHAILVQARRLLAEGVDPQTVVAEVSGLYHLDDFIYSERTPELRFWYECWISDTEPVPLDLERLGAIATEIVGRWLVDLRQADSIVVVSGSSFNRQKRRSNEVLARSGDSTELAQLVAAMRMDWSATPMDWMEWPSATIAFLSGRSVVAEVSLLSCGWLRSESCWEGGGDLPLLSKSEFRSALMAIDGALDQHLLSWVED